MRKLLGALVFMLAATQAHAQATVEICYRSTPTSQFCQPLSATNALPVTATGGGAGGTTPVASAPGTALNTAGCTVGVASAQCKAAAGGMTWLQVQNTSATNSVACSWGGTAALNANSSFMLAPGQAASWGLVSSGVSTQALNCIASAAATPLYLEWR